MVVSISADTVDEHRIDNICIEANSFYCDNIDWFLVTDIHLPLSANVSISNNQKLVEAEAENFDGISFYLLFEYGYLNIYAI